MVWSNDSPPPLQGVPIITDPHLERALGYKLAPPKDDVIYDDSKLPDWAGGDDPRLINLQITNAAVEIKACTGPGEARYASVYKAILAVEGGTSLTAKTKNQDDEVEDRSARLLSARFPVFRLLSQDQIISAVELDQDLLADKLIRFAAITHVIATYNDQIVKVSAGEIEQVPTFYLDRQDSDDTLDDQEWNPTGNFAGEAYTLNNIPDSPVRRDRYAAAQSRATELAARVRALEAAQPPNDPAADVNDQERNDRDTITKRLQALEADNESLKKKRRLDDDHEGTDPANPLSLTLDQTQRTAALRGKGVLCTDDMTIFYCKPVARAAVNGSFTGMLEKAYAHALGPAAHTGSFVMSVSKDETISFDKGVQIQTPVTILDYTMICKVLIASLTHWSPADAATIERHFIPMVIEADDRTSGDSQLLLIAVDLVMTSFISGAANGRDGGMPPVDSNLIEHAERLLSRNRSRAAREKTAKDELRASAKLANQSQHPSPAAPSNLKGFNFPKGSALVGPHTKLTTSKIPGAARERCNNHDNGRPCAFAYKNGNCPRLHLGPFGADKGKKQAAPAAAAAGPDPDSE